MLSRSKVKTKRRERERKDPIIVIARTGTQ